jgi:hypothetical protein
MPRAWDLPEALRTCAFNARATARMLEKRAGRIPGGRPLQVPSERAAAERRALAFYEAANRIERMAEEIDG